MAEEDTQIDSGMPDFNGTDVTELTDDIAEVVEDDAVIDDVDPTPLVGGDEDEEKIEEELDPEEEAYFYQDKYDER